jgi:hypothetical protein
MLRHLGLIAVCACIGASVGCDGGREIGFPPPPPPSPTVTVEFGGRVVNAETGGPVANVRVSVSALSSSGGGLREASGELATSAGDGTFTFTLDQLPSDWRLVGLLFTGPPGYDDRGGRLEPTAAPCRISPCWAVADRPAIRMYPTLVIRPGESIEVRVEPGVNACAFGGGFDCRRVMVDAPPGEPVELEIVPHDTSKPMGLVESVWSEEPELRLTVAGGVAYVYNAGTATLTARR